MPKEQNKEIRKSKLHNLLIVLASSISVFVGGAFWIKMIYDFSYGSGFVFRPLALLPLIALIINIGLILLLYRRIQMAEAGFWFLAFLGTLATWAFTEFMQRISPSVALADDWRLPAVFSWSLMPIMYLFFVISYVDKQYLIRKLHLQIGIFIMVSSIVYAQFTTDLVVSGDYFLHSWGYDSANSIFLNIFGLWISIIFIIAMTIFIIDYRNSLDLNRRRQIKVFMIGVSLSLVTGVTTDIVFPVLGYGILPMAVFFTSLHGLIVAYGIYKYGMFKVSPETLSGEIMETLPQPVIVTDEKFNIHFMNANAEEMFSSKGSLVGKGIQDIFGAENTKNINNLKDNLADGEVINIEKMPLAINQNVIIAQAKIKTIPQSSGYIFGLSNITQQVLSMQVIEKEVKQRTSLYNQEKARLMASIDGLHQGFLIIDDNQKISLMNSKSQNMFPKIKISSVQPGHVVDGSKVSDLNEYFEGVEIDKMFDEAVKNNKYVVDKKVDFQDRILDIEITPVVIENDAIGAVILLDDVTDVAIAERSKDEFFSIASHELRTPLTAIRGNTSMLLNHYLDKINDKDMEEMLGDIHESSRRLIEIVNDFLDTSRLEQGRMQFNMQKVNLQELVNAVIKDTTMIAEEFGDKVESDEAIAALPSVYADPDKLKQVLYNLLGNSIKFTNNGIIRVSALKEGVNIRITIADNGRGIQVESRRLLFKKFQQASSSIITRDTTKGTGLGLYISKMLLNKMGGTIRLDSSEVGKGSVFSFTVPIAGSTEDNSRFSQKIL